MRSSTLLIIIGVFLVARTIIKDDKGQNLVDRILGLNKPNDDKKPASTSDRPAIVAGATVTIDQVAQELARIIAANQDPGGIARPATNPGGGH